MFYSFQVNPEVIPGRMTLLVTIFLVLINIFNTIQTNSPKAEGLTAIEAWVIACIIFVFGALGEYTVILLKIKLKKLTPRRKRTKTPPQPQSQQQQQQPSVAVQTTSIMGHNNSTTTVTGGQQQTNSSVGSGGGHHTVRPNHASLTMPAMRRDNYGHTDLVFLIVFPCLFGAFNLFYWFSLYWWRWDDSLSDLKWGN